MDDRTRISTDILCALIAIADPDCVDPEHLAHYAILTADALLVRLKLNADRDN